MLELYVPVVYLSFLGPMLVSCSGIPALAFLICCLAVDQKAHYHLGSIVTLVRELFDVLGCADADGADLLHDTGITPSTLMPHLGLIEQRLHDVLRQHSEIIDKSRSTGELVGLGPPVPTGTVKLHVPPPRLEDFEDDPSVSNVQYFVCLFWFCLSRPLRGIEYQLMFVLWLSFDSRIACCIVRASTINQRGTSSNCVPRPKGYDSCSWSITNQHRTRD